MMKDIQIDTLRMYRVINIDDSCEEIEIYHKNEGKTVTSLKEFFEDLSNTYYSIDKYFYIVDDEMENKGVEYIKDIHSKYFNLQMDSRGKEGTYKYIWEEEVREEISYDEETLLSKFIDDVFKNKKESEEDILMGKLLSVIKNYNVSPENEMNTKDKEELKHYLSLVQGYYTRDIDMFLEYHKEISNNVGLDIVLNDKTNKKISNIFEGGL